jgi:hypothetical protein
VFRNSLQVLASGHAIGRQKERMAAERACQPLIDRVGSSRRPPHASNDSGRRWNTTTRSLVNGAALLATWTSRHTSFRIPALCRPWPSGLRPVRRPRQRRA